MIYFDKEKHDIEETNTETFMCRSMSATNAYTELYGMEIFYLTKITEVQINDTINKYNMNMSGDYT